MSTEKNCARCDRKFRAKSAAHKYCSRTCRSRGPADSPAPKYTLTDVSNHLLATGPSALSCGVSETSEGSACLIMTVRTTSSTVTVVLSPQDAAAWLAEFAYKVKAIQDAAA